MYRILKYINENLENRITEKEVADRFGYSLTYFSEKFKSYTGCTFRTYVNKRTMQYAAKCIRENDKITDIAFDLGYNGLNGFEKAFRNEFGISPIQYKKQEQAKRTGHAAALPSNCVEMIAEKKSGETAQKYRGQHLYNFMKGYYAVPRGDRTIGNLICSSLCTLLNDFTPFIEKNELIVGYNYDDDGMEINGYYNQTAEEYQCLREYLKKGVLQSAQIDEILANLIREDDRYISNYMLFDMLEEYSAINCTPEADRDILFDNAAVGLYKTNNHSIPDFQAVLEKGFEGILKEVQQHYSETGSPFYLRLIELCKACGRIGKKYAELAAKMAAETSDKAEKARLEEIARVCEKVPEKPAATFREALQSIFFTHIINTWEDGVNANSLGRLDQILYPYYCRDIASHRITKEEAYELLCCFWIKLYRPYDVQNVTIGGCDKNGNDAVNELSYMFLDVMNNCNIVRCLTVRYSSLTEKAFLRKCFESIKNGQPTFCNDDEMIPALVSKNISLEDARGYALLGCTEPTIPGKSNSHSSTACVNLAKAIEYTLGQGTSLFDRRFSDGVATKDPCSFKSFNQFLDSVYIHLDRIIRSGCNIVLSCYEKASQSISLPYKTMLTENCISNQCDYANTGAKYNYYQMMLAGFANLIDSLEAVRTVIFQDKTFTMKQLLAFISSDFPDEKIRDIFINHAPKFGNNIIKTDDLACEVYEKICDIMNARQTADGRMFHPQFFSYSNNISMGQFTAATPDGRRKGDALSYGVAPMNGCDINGFKEALKSVSKLSASTAAGGIAVILDVSPSIFTGINMDSALDFFIDASGTGLSTTVFNLINPDELRSALNDPPNYPDLYINIYGFSQNICNFSDEERRLIMQRTNHMYS